MLDEELQHAWSVRVLLIGVHHPLTVHVDSVEQARETRMLISVIMALCFFMLVLIIP